MELTLSSENVFGTVLAMFMMLDVRGAGDKTMEGNLLGSEGTGSPDIVMGLPTTNRVGLGKVEETVSSTRLGFFRGGRGGSNHERVYP